MSKKLGILALVLSVVGICLAGASLIISLNKGSQQAETVESEIQYVMYVGTNDKDTYEPKYTHEEAMNIVDEVCLKYFEGYTIQEALGSWTDETGTPTHEYTIVCYFDGADKDSVYKAADEIIVALNQNTVLIETNIITVDYYSGK